MGFLSDIFGDEGERDAMMQRAFAQYEERMTGYLADFESRFESIIGDLEAERDADMAAFTQGFQNAISNYQEAVIGRLESGFGEARGLMEEGFDQTLEDIDRQTEAASLRSLAQGALSGLGATSFGQAQTEAIRTEGGRERRRADEQFRREMSNLALSEAGALAEAGGNLTSLMVQQTTGESDLRRAYSSAITGLGTTMASTLLEGGSNIAGLGYDTMMQRVANIGTGFNLGEAIINTGLSMLASGAPNPGGQTQQTPFQYSSQSYGMGPQGGGYGTISTGGELPSGLATFNPAYGQGGGYTYQTY